MKQEINSEVEGGVAGRDIVTYSDRSIVNVNFRPNHRALTSQERIELNDRVNRLDEQYGEPGWKTWRFLHRTIGIESVEAMRLDQRDSAHAILDLLLERADLQRNLNRRHGDTEASTGQIESLRVQNSEQGFRLQESINHCRQLDMDLSASRRRASRLLALLSAAVLTTVAGTAAAYYQSGRAKAAEARLRLCELGGKAFTLGSVVDGSPARECVRTNDGRTVWKAVSEKTRRPR